MSPRLHLRSHLHHDSFMSTPVWVNPNSELEQVHIYVLACLLYYLSFSSSFSFSKPFNSSTYKERPACSSSWTTFFIDLQELSRLKPSMELINTDGMETEVLYFWPCKFYETEVTKFPPGSLTTTILTLYSLFSKPTSTYL